MKKSSKAISLALLEPYVLPADCPYLSEEQRELSTLPALERIEWMGEWLHLVWEAEKMGASV